MWQDVAKLSDFSVLWPERPPLANAMRFIEDYCSEPFHEFLDLEKLSKRAIFLHDNLRANDYKAVLSRLDILLR